MGNDTERTLRMGNHTERATHTIRENRMMTLQILLKIPQLEKEVCINTLQPCKWDVYDLATIQQQKWQLTLLRFLPNYSAIFPTVQQPLLTFQTSNSVQTALDVLRALGKALKSAYLTVVRYKRTLESFLLWSLYGHVACWRSRGVTIPRTLGMQWIPISTEKTSLLSTEQTI